MALLFMAVTVVVTEAVTVVTRVENYFVKLKCPLVK